VAALEGYLPLRRAARRARAALWLSILLALASAAANLGDTRIARQLAGDGASSGDLYLWVGLVQAAWFLVTAGLWLGWFRRAYLNLPALGPGGCAIAPGGPFGPGCSRCSACSGPSSC
jgi:hypothetical protein